MVRGNNLKMLLCWEGGIDKNVIHLILINNPNLSFMNQVKLIFSIIVLLIISLAPATSVASSASSVIPASAGDNPGVSKKLQQLSFMKWFVKLSPKEYGKMRGKKLNIFEKASFKLTQYRMKQQLKSYRKDITEGANWGGFALGLFLGLIGVLGAYIFSDDTNFIKWTWIGCGVWVVIFLLFVV